MNGPYISRPGATRVAKPYALVKLDGKLTLAEVVTMHSEGLHGPLTGYRVRPLTDDGVYVNAPVPKNDLGQWIRPIHLFKDWATRPSAANLSKAIDAARQDIFA